MIQNEVVMLLLGLGVLLFILGNRSNIRRIPSGGILTASLVMFLVGVVLTILEGFFLTDLLNVLEHLCYLVSAMLMALWCWQVFGRTGRADR